MEKNILSTIVPCTPWHCHRKCKKNQDGKVVLPSGAYIPRNITGKCLCDHVNKSHRKNPNQLGAATLIHTINKHILKEQKSTNSSVYQLTVTNCIVVLEAELHNLWGRRQNFPLYPNCTHAKKARNINVEIEDDKEAVTAARAWPSRVEEVIDKEKIVQSQTRSFKNDLPTSMTTQPSKTPKHPFRHAKDAAYTPLTSKNVGTQDKQEPAYITLPLIHDPLIAETVYKQLIETQITITERKLLSLFPEVRSQFRDKEESQTKTLKPHKRFGKKR